MPQKEEQFPHKRKIVIKKDNLVSADAVLDAFEKGKHLILPSVIEFIKKAIYESSNEEFCAISLTPEELGFKKDCTFGEVIEFARKTYDLKILSDQQVYRLRCVLKEKSGQMFFVASEPVYYKGQPYLYLLERLVVNEHSALSDVDGDYNLKLFKSSKIIFRLPW